MFDSINIRESLHHLQSVPPQYRQIRTPDVAVPKSVRKAILAGGKQKTMAVSQATTKGGINFLGTQIHVIGPGRRLAETQQRNQIFILLEPSASKGDFQHGNNKKNLFGSQSRYCQSIMHCNGWGTTHLPTLQNAEFLLIVLQIYVLA